MKSSLLEQNISFLGEKEQEINIKANEISTLDLRDVEDASLTLFLQKNSSCNLRIFFNNSKNSLVLHANLAEKAKLNVYFADFANGNTSFSSNIVLYGNASESSFNFSSLTKNEEIKNYEISYSHIGENTISTLEGYSVNMNSSKLKVAGVSHIEKGAIKANASQKVKAILFDKESAAIANPILKIDCDDISASHACAIGSLNDDHLFYLLSRGIPLEDAKKLITFGYLNPIVNYFGDEDRNELNDLITKEF